MVKRKAKSRRPKSKVKSIQLKRRARKNRRVSRSYSPYSGWNNFLDKSVPMRSLLKYSGITLAFILVLLAVFMLGRISVNDNDSPGSAEQPMQLSGQTKQTIKSNPEPENHNSNEIEAEDTEEGEATEEAEEYIDVTESPEPENSNDVEYEYRAADEDEEEGAPEEDSCKKTVAGFDYTYTLVDVSATNFNKELKGDNWGSITALKLTITNNEPCTIINPTKIKIKLNPKGKGSVWWDDDLFLPDSFKHMLPGTTVSEILPIHVTYSDIYSEKDFRLTVFDDYDIPIHTIKEYMTLH
jgi:cytoskeletal protein RodZ